MDKHSVLRKVASWPTLIGFAIGAFVVVFLVYPPAPGWGSSEKWGDIGTWIGSITTGTTAVAALWIAVMERSERRLRERRRALLLAMDLHAPLIDLKGEVFNARRLLRDPVKFFRDQGFDQFVADIRLPSAAKFPRGVLLEGITEALAGSFANLAKACALYDALVTASVMAARSEGLSDGVIAECFDFVHVLDKVQEMMVYVAETMNGLGGPAITTDMRDKGDGTRLA